MLVVFYAACTVERNIAEPGKDQIVISVIGTNDVHGQFLAARGRGGMTTFSGYVENLRQARAADGGVLLVDGGDMWQGTLESNINEGALMVEAFNALGYAAAAIGNHEFDFGPAGPAAVPSEPGDDPRGNLKRRAKEAKFPLLAANLIDESTGRVVDWENVRPSTIVEVAGVKIGIVGILTKSTPATTILANVSGLRIAPLTETIIREASALREQGAMLVIVTAHAGGRCTEYDDPRDLSSCDLSGEILAVANSLPRGLIDHIVGGHEGHAVAHVINGTVVTIGLSYGRVFGRADFRIDLATGRVEDINVHRPQPICPFYSAAGDCAWVSEPAPGIERARYEGRPVLPTFEVEAVAERALGAVAASRGEWLGVELETAFTLENNPESTLGNLVTDVLRESLDVDIAVLNVSGGLRANLPDGRLLYGNVYEMFPFDNRVVILVLSGAEVRRIIEASIFAGDRRPGFSGMRVEAGCTEGKLDIRLHLANGRRIENEDSLRVAVNDFLATSGDGILTPVMPASGFVYEDDPRLIRDVIADWFRNRGGRLNAADYASHRAPRWQLTESLPAACRQ